MCSGGLIGSNRVLTAGHCVWDDRNAQGPFKDLRFAPGQWKVSVGVGLGYMAFVMLFEGGVEFQNCRCGRHERRAPCKVK